MNKEELEKFIRFLRNKEQIHSAEGGERNRGVAIAMAFIADKLAAPTFSEWLARWDG